MFDRGLGYFIMQSDVNRKKVIRYAETAPMLSLDEILKVLKLSSRDFTDIDYLTLKRQFGAKG